MHAVELAPGRGQVARDAGARRDHDRVEARAQLLGVHVAADVDAAAQLHALRGELLDAPLHHPLLDLEVGHAEAHEAADRLVALEQRHGVARAAQLLCRRHPRRAGAHHRHPLAGFAPRRARRHPALRPRAVDDRVLDLFDRHRVALADLEHARRLARRRAQPAGELGEVVGGVQLRDRVAEAVAVDEVVPVGDEVPERAAVVAEGDPAVHAAGALVAQLCHGPLHLELAIVASALGGVPVRDSLAVDLEEAAELAHQAPASPTASSERRATSAPFARAASASASSSASSRSTRL